MATPSAEQLRFPLHGDFWVWCLFFFFPPLLLTPISRSGTHLRPHLVEAPSRHLAVPTSDLQGVLIRSPSCSTAWGAGNHQQEPLGSSHQPQGGVMVPCLVGHSTSFGSRALHQGGPHTPLTFLPLPREMFSPSVSPALMPPNSSPLQRAGMEFLGGHPTGMVLPWEADLTWRNLGRSPAQGAGLSLLGRS